MPELDGWLRVEPPALLRREFPGIRVWQREAHDGHLSVFVCREMIDSANGGRRPLWHLSISHRTNTRPAKPGRYPTWDEIREARERFTPDEVTMAILLPPRAEWVNEHPTTFHLWEVDGDV
jgi:hypothetical protein